MTYYECSERDALAIKSISKQDLSFCSRDAKRPFINGALMSMHISRYYAATGRQFADVFTKAKAPTAAMIMLLKALTCMEGTAAVPLLARLYQ